MHPSLLPTGRQNLNDGELFVVWFLSDVGFLWRGATRRVGVTERCLFLSDPLVGLGRNKDRRGVGIRWKEPRRGGGAGERAAVLSASATDPLSPITRETEALQGGQGLTRQASHDHGPAPMWWPRATSRDKGNDTRGWS